jgi:WD40 repeat protein
MVFSPDSRTMAIGGSGHVELWEMETHTRRWLVDRQCDQLNFSRDGATLAVGVTSEDGGRLLLLDVNSGRLLKVIAPPEEAEQFPPAITRDFKTAAWACEDGRIVLRELNSRKEWSILPVPGDREMYLGEFSPDGRTLSIAHGRTLTSVTRCSLLDVESGQLDLTLKDADPFSPSPTFFDDGLSLVGSKIGMNYRAMTVWNSQTGEEVVHMRLPRTAIINLAGLAVAPDGTTVVAGTYYDPWADSWLKKVPLLRKLVPTTISRADVTTWNVSTGMESCTICVGTDWLHNLVFSTDGTVLVTSHSDGIIKLWQMP